MFRLAEKRFFLPFSTYCALAHGLDQLHLLWLHCRDAYTFDLAVGGVENLKTHTFIFHHLASARNAAGKLADQSGNRRRGLAVRLDSEEFVEPVDIHPSG